MEICWLGTASIALRSERTLLLFDPYNQPFQESFEGISTKLLADTTAVLITHPHLDHFGDIGVFAEQMKCLFYVNARGIEIAERDYPHLHKFRRISAGDVMQINNLRITVHQGLHCRLEIRQLPGVLARTKSFRAFVNSLKMLRMQMDTYSIGRDDILTYEISDGDKTVFLMGSANVRKEDAGVKNADLLVYPYQGRLEMMKYSEKILNHYTPKRVLLSHFDDAFPPLTTRMDTAGFIAYMKGKQPQMEIIEPAEGEWYTV